LSFLDAFGCGDGEETMRILIFVDHYLPGYKAGGPIRSVSGLVNAAPPDLEWFIVTRDRDHTETKAYASVNVGEWNEVGRARVYYASPAELTARALARLARATRPDVVYLNSAFSRMTVQCLLARRLGMFPESALVVAPRGELSPGALRLKRLKKRLFLAAAASVGMFRHVLWQATSERERAEIIETLGAQTPVAVATNVSSATPAQCASRRPKRVGAVRFVFASRISAKKNLLFALRIAGSVRGDVAFDIFGPIDDPAYWRACEGVIRQLPENVKVTYGGALAHDEIHAAIGLRDFFIFPTLGENFGHAIVESLAARCPIVLSDTTPWDVVASRRAGWVLPLAEEDVWVTALQSCVNMSAAEHDEMSSRAAELAQEFADGGRAVEMTVNLFRQAVAAPRLGRASRSL
jgi:glycosyltransferase involved in cell wall biosynthesis